MLTSFFGKSSPLKFLLISLYMFSLGILSFTKEFSSETGGEEVIQFVVAIALLIFSIFLLDFIVRKNALTLNTSFVILLFACMVMMLPILVCSPILVGANVFVMLALRRIFSLGSGKNTERKILDASLWIGLASIFYFWSLLLIIALYAALYLKPQKSFRYFLIPVATWIALFLIATAGHFLWLDSFEWFLDWLGDASFDFSAYAPKELVIFITFIGAMVIWTTISMVGTISSKKKKDRPHQFLAIYVLMVTVLLSLFAAEKKAGEFIFFLGPAAIVIANFIERKSEIWFKETLLWTFVLLPILFLLL